YAGVGASQRRVRSVLAGKAVPPRVFRRDREERSKNGRVPRNVVPLEVERVLPRRGRCLVVVEYAAEIAHLGGVRLCIGARREFFAPPDGETDRRAIGGEKAVPRRGCERKGRLDQARDARSV